ncbi:hypothetical protein GCM10009557_47470 [Virgisporangium ochraceum]
MGETGSPLGLAAHAVLTGAVAALSAALDKADPHDPARDAVSRVHADLLALRGCTSTGPDATGSAGAVSARTHAGLVALAAAMAADRDAASWLPSDVDGDPPEVRWRRAWTALLRLPAEVATRLCPATVDGDVGWSTVAGPVATVVVAPDPDLGVDGLHVAPDGIVDPRLTAAVEGAVDNPRHGTVTALANVALALGAVDPDLCHALESLRARGFHPMTDDAVRRAYGDELLRRVRAWALAAPGTVAEALALHEVDEAFCSLVHLPPAAPDSWWGVVQGLSRDCLRQAVHAAGGQIRTLDQDYPTARRYTGGADLSHHSGRSRAGTVLTTLRVWLRVPGDEVPGRVVFGRE